MSSDLAFKGSVSVESTPTGFTVCFQSETDAHNLGHALAAIVSTYLDVVNQSYADCDIDEICEMVFEGLHCGLDNNSGQLTYH